jgi:tyrosinase
MTLLNKKEPLADNHRLLHCHIDRLTAIWQAMNYQDTEICELPSYTPRATAVSGTKENGTSNLEPWHSSEKHDTNDYWIANHTKDLDSTFKYGYYYPETPLDLRNDEISMKKYATAQVHELYAPPEVLKRIHRVAPAGTAKENVSTELSTGSQNYITSSATAALKPIRSVEWRAFVRVKSFAVPGTWGIHLFFGEPPAESSTWFMSDRRIGTVNILTNSNLNSCPNCKSQSEADLLVTGLVLLSNELEKRNIDIGDQNAVVQYLKENLTWRIAKDAKNVEIMPEMALTVGVAARDVVYPLSAAELPVWSEVEIFPAATEGKVGGLEQGVEEV